MAIYFDMDGVLAKYSYAAYEGENPEFLRVDGHYFRTIEEDPFALSTFNHLLDLCGEEVYVLTSISRGQPIKNQQMFDKMYWLEEKCPRFDLGTHFIACSSDKRNCVELIKGMFLSHQDLLIDDYNPNLVKWAKGGGRSVKYLNGINSLTHWDGLYINSDGESALNTARYIYTLWLSSLPIIT